MNVLKDTWVLIKKVVLEPNERPATLPEETRKVPLVMWVKGWLLEDAKIGEVVHIKTRTNRFEEGTLLEVNPTYKHNYGNFVPEILKISQIVSSFMEGQNE